MREVPSPLVLHLPHGATALPRSARRTLLVDRAALGRELLRMTDHHTDGLFALPGAARVVFPVSRLVVDPERFPDDADEPMAAVGMGVIYTHGAHGERLREAPSPARRRAWLRAHYFPHHAALAGAVDRALAAWGTALVVDCHSFPSRPLPYELDPHPDRPELCLGTDPFHTDPTLVAGAEALARAEGWTVAVNRPFQGALVPAKHLGQDRRVQALMIEVRRDLYLDERTGQTSAAFPAVQAALTRLLAGLEHLVPATAPATRGPSPARPSASGSTLA